MSVFAEPTAVMNIASNPLLSIYLYEKPACCTQAWKCPRMEHPKVRTNPGDDVLESYNVPDRCYSGMHNQTV